MVSLCLSELLMLHSSRFKSMRKFFNSPQEHLRSIHYTETMYLFTGRICAYPKGWSWYPHSHLVLKGRYQWVSLPLVWLLYQNITFEWHKQEKFISHRVLEAGVKDQGDSWFSSWWELSCWLADGHLFAVFSEDKARKRENKCLLISTFL